MATIATTVIGSRTAIAIGTADSSLSFSGALEMEKNMPAKIDSTTCRKRSKKR